MAERDAWDALREMLPPEAAQLLVVELEARRRVWATCRLALILDIRQGVPRPEVRVLGLRAVNAYVLT